MPKRGQKYAPGMPYDEAVAEFGEDAVRMLPRLDNVRVRGVPWHEVARLRKARTVHRGSGAPALEVAGMPISAAERGALLEAQRVLLAILRANPDQFRRWLELMKTMK
jgi:hypothetical protein